MSITLRLRRHEADATFEIPDGASVVISENGDVEVSLSTAATTTRRDVDVARYETEAQIKVGHVSRYTVKASTTGHGKPPEIGGFADVFTNIHEPDPTDPEVRPLVRIAHVTNTHDPNPETTRNRKVEIELELSQSELERIKLHEHRNSFTFRPVDSDGRRITKR